MDIQLSQYYRFIFTAKMSLFGPGEQNVPDKRRYVSDKQSSVRTCYERNERIKYIYKIQQECSSTDRNTGPLNKYYQRSEFKTQVTPTVLRAL